MKLTTFALAALSLSPVLMAQSQHGTVEFTQPRAPRARAVQVQQQDAPPKLGVMVSETDDGVLVSEIFEGSLAEGAGVQPDDILFKIGGSRVGEVADIPALLGEVAPGGDVTLTVIRPGQGLVTLRGRRPAPQPVAVDPIVEPRGAFLGVEIGAADGQGVRIVDVIDGTAAWYAGLSEGDTLLALDGHKVDAPEDLAELVGRHAPGDLIGMTYRSGDKRYETRLRLGDRLGAGNPLGALFGPGGTLPFGDDGDVFFGQPGDVHGNLRFFGRDGGVQVFGDGGGVWFSEDDQGHDGWISDEDEAHAHGRGKETHGRLHPDGDHGSPRELKIQIQDGVMTIQRDGEVEVIELDAASQGGRRTSFQVHGDQDHDIVASVVALTDSLEAECDALAAESEALAAECEALAAECDTAAEAQVQTIALAISQAQDACAEAAAECAAMAAECADDSQACEDEASDDGCDDEDQEAECCSDAEECEATEPADEDSVT